MHPLVNSKISRFSGIRYKISYRLNLSTAKNLYFSCVQSCLVYCLVVWGGVLLCSHRCDKTFKLQKRTVKMYSVDIAMDQTVFLSVHGS